MVREQGAGSREQGNSLRNGTTGGTAGGTRHDAGQLTNDQLRVLRRAISLYGHTRQALKAIEEMGELTQALSKVISPRIYRAAGEPAGVPDLEHLYEEIADVEIMLKQLRLMTGADADVDAWIDRKIERLEARMREETRP